MASGSPPARPPLLIRWTPGPLRFFIGWLLWAPLPLRIAFVLITVGGTAACGFYLWQHRAMVKRNRAVGAGWREFEAARRAGDEAAMRAGLQAVLAGDPVEEQALRRLKALDTGTGDPTDPEMLGFLIRIHLRAGRAADAEREADRLLAKTPGDWFARCVKAARRLADGDRAGTERELDALTAPGARTTRIDPPALLWAFQLYRRVGRDAAPLRTFAQSGLLPALRTPAAAALAPLDKLTLVDCYLEAFDPATDRPQPPAVVQAWAGADQLSDAAVEQAAATGDVTALARAGQHGPRLHAALQLLRKHDQITADQYAELSKEVEDRTRKAWEAVLAKEPTRAEAHTGLALSYGRTGDYPTARDRVVRGIEATGGSDPDLAALFARMLALEGRPLDAYASLKRSAEQRPGEPVWWALAAEAALAAGNRQLALAACEKLRQANPTDKWAVRTEARLWLDADQPAKALAVLAPVPTKDLLTDPTAVRLYARAAAEVGPEGRPAEFTAAAEAAAVQANNPMVAVAALRGWLDAPPTAARAETVAARADALQARWPADAPLLRVTADARYLAAERADPPWPLAKVQAAVLAVEQLQLRLPGDTDSLVSLGWLRLLGERNPEQAARDLAPLAEGADAPTRSVAELEVLGAVYLATARTADAVRVLDRAARSRDATTGCFIYLALAQHAAGNSQAARSALAVARMRPRSPREQAPYRAAVDAVLK